MTTARDAITHTAAALPDGVERLVDTLVSKSNARQRAVEEAVLRKLLDLLLLAPAEVHDRAVEGTLPALLDAPARLPKARRFAAVVTRQDQLRARRNA